MITSTQQLVVPDGTGTLAPASGGRYAWCYGSDVTMPIEIVHQSGAPYVLTGRVAALLGIYLNEGDLAPLVQLEWTITDAAHGLASFSFTRDMAPLLVPGEYAIGVQFRDDDVGREDTVWSGATLTIGYRPADFAEPVTVPGTQQPLAQGPNYGHSSTFVAFPDPATKPWLGWIADDTGVLYFSNGTAWVPSTGSTLAVQKIQRLSGGTRTVIFVRMTGNDTTGDGRTAQTAYRTIDRARLDVPLIKRDEDNYVIECTGLNEPVTANVVLPAMLAGRTGLATYPGSPDFPAFFAEGDLTFQAIPQLQVTLNPGTTTQVVNPTTGNVMVTDTSKLWSTDQWQGLQVISADLSDMRTVIESGSNWLLIEGSSPVTSPSIYDYGAKLVATGGVCALLQQQAFDGVLALNGIKLDVANIDEGDTGFSCSTPTMNLWAIGSWISEVNASELASFTGFHIVVQWVLTVNAVDDGSFMTGLLLDLIDTAAITNFGIFGGGIVSSTMPSGFGSNVLSVTELQIQSVDIIQSLIQAVRGATSMSSVKFSRCANNCVNVLPGSLLELRTGIRDGGSNVGYGVYVAPGGKATYLESDLPTVTGTLGDFKVGTLPARAWSDLQRAPIGLEYDAFGGGALLTSLAHESVAVPVEASRVSYHWRYRGGAGPNFLQVLAEIAPLTSAGLGVVITSDDPNPSGFDIDQPFDGSLIYFENINLNWNVGAKSPYLFVDSFLGNYNSITFNAPLFSTDQANVDAEFDNMQISVPYVAGPLIHRANGSTGAVRVVGGKLATTSGGPSLAQLDAGSGMNFGLTDFATVFASPGYPKLVDGTGTVYIETDISTAAFARLPQLFDAGLTIANFDAIQGGELTPYPYDGAHPAVPSPPGVGVLRVDEANKRLMMCVDATPGAQVFQSTSAVVGAALPVANASMRGQTYTVLGAAGVADQTYVCLKSAADTYSWKLIATG